MTTTGYIVFSIPILLFIWLFFIFLPGRSLKKEVRLQKTVDLANASSTGVFVIKHTVPIYGDISITLSQDSFTYANWSTNRTVSYNEIVGISRYRPLGNTGVLKTYVMFMWTAAKYKSFNDQIRLNLRSGDTLDIDPTYLKRTDISNFINKLVAKNPQITIATDISNMTNGGSDPFNNSLKRNISIIGMIGTAGLAMSFLVQPEISSFKDPFDFVLIGSIAILFALSATWFVTTFKKNL